MSILNCIKCFEAVYNNGFFLCDGVSGIAAGDSLRVIGVPDGVSGYPGAVSVFGIDGDSLSFDGKPFGVLSDGDVFTFGFAVGLRDPQSLQWDIADLEAASGRNQAGKYFRDRIGVKRTLSCSWGALSDEDVAVLLSMMEGNFFMLEYPDALTGKVRCSEFYVGNRTAPMMRKSDDGSYMWQNLSATFTER